MAGNYKGTNIPKSYDPEQEAARQARIAAATAAENATLTPEQKTRRRQMADEVMDRIREESFADQAPINLEGGVPLDSVMNLVRPNGQPATQPAATDTPATQPAAPEQVQPAPAQGSPYTKIGNETRTVYGSKVRYVDQRPGMGGAVRWAEIDANGNETAKDADGNPIMPSSQAQAERGGLSDDPDIARWRGQAQYNRMKADERKKAKGARDNLLAETVAQMGELFQSHGEIRKSTDGKLYRVYMERNGDGDNPVSRLNKMNIDMGRGGNLTSIAIAQEVDADGNPVGKPVIKYGIAQDGGKKATAIRNLDIGTVMNRWADTYAAANGISQLEGRRRAVERFGGSEQVFGRNPNNWDIALTAQEVEAAKQKQLDAQNALAKSKIDNQNAQFYASLGLDEKKLRQNQEQFDKNYDLAERKAGLAERQFDEQVRQTIRSADREDMKLAYEIVTGLQAAGKGMTTGDILRGLGDKAIEQFYKVPVVDENGKPVLDVEGKQATRPPQTEAEYQQCTDALVKAVNALRGEGSGSSIRDRFAQFQQAKVAIAGGNAAPAAPAQGATTQEPDKDITLPDGRAGRVHNGKTYVQDGKDASGNLRWMPVEAQATTATQGGGAASNPVGDMAQPVGKLGEQTTQPQYSDEDRAAAIAKLRERGVNFDGGKANPPAAGTEKPNPGTEKPVTETPKPNADIRRDMAARGKATAANPVQEANPVQKANGETGTLEFEITKSGGTWTEDDEGRRTIEIGNWDYLPPEVKERFPKTVVETDDKDLEFDKIRDWQTLANERKAKYESEREAERKRFEKSLANRNLTARRVDVLVEKHLRKWDAKNDPRRMRSASSERARANDSLSLSL